MFMAISSMVVPLASAEPSVAHGPFFLGVVGLVIVKDRIAILERGRLAPLGYFFNIFSVQILQTTSFSNS